MLNLILNFLLFFPLTVFSTYSIGFLILKPFSKELEDQEIISLSFCLGVVSFVLTGFILSFLNLRFLSIFLLIGLNFFCLAKFKLSFFAPFRVFIRRKMLTLLIFLGILIQGFINFPSGYLYNGELLFWSSQGHDGLWHVALIEEIKKTLPANNPVFAGEALYNYHYLVDVLMGEFARVFPIFSSLDLYFRFFPVLFSFLIGISVFSFVNRWRNNLLTGYLAIFFTYFTGSFGYIVTYIKHGAVFAGETVFWAAQPNTIIGNPPHAISFSLLTSFLLAFYLYFKQRKAFWLGVSFFIGAFLAGFKVSGGVVLIAAVCAAALVDLVFNRNFVTVVFALSLTVANYIVFKLLTRQGEGHLMFLPWWFIRTMVVAGDRLDWIDLEHRRQHYLSKGTWNAYLRVVQLETIAFMIFLFGNIGTRFLGLFEVIKAIFSRKFYLNPFDVGLLALTITGFLIPIFFVQQGIIYNNIQFFQFFILGLGFYAASFTAKLLQFNKSFIFKALVMVIIFIFSVPTVAGNLVEFYGPGKTALAKVSSSEIEALNFLSKNSNSSDIVLNLPFDKYLKDKYPTQPKPIYAWYSTPYIPALSFRSTYLSTEEQVLITGYPLDERLNNLKKFFEGNDYIWANNFLEENINFIYLQKQALAKPLSEKDLKIQKAFENDEIIIYRVI